MATVVETARHVDFGDRPFCLRRHHEIVGANIVGGRVGTGGEIL